MESLYNVNGLMFWSEREIRLRRVMAEHFQATLRETLLGFNPAWRFVEIEAPLLTPRTLINPNYTNQDVWAQVVYRSVDEQAVEEASLVLRPETTPGSYVAADHMLKSQQGFKLPLVVWQSGKSFRREQDQVTKNMRLKEFYQQEFQCLYASDTMMDYHAAVMEPVCKMIAEMVHLPTRIVPSDRLPSYSQITMDVEVNNGDKWMEVCSISRRTDFPSKVYMQTKKGIVEKEVLVLEVAIGLDRCVYNFDKQPWGPLV